MIWLKAGSRRRVLGSASRTNGHAQEARACRTPPHELADDFPQDVEKIHELKVSNPHFAKLMDEYHEINRAVHRAETGVEPCDQLAETAMRKERMRLKDEIAGMLAKA